MSEDKDDNKIDYSLRKTGLYVPKHIPDGGKTSPVGFIRALEEKKNS